MGLGDSVIVMVFAVVVVVVVVVSDCSSAFGSIFCFRFNRGDEGEVSAIFLERLFVLLFIFHMAEEMYGMVSLLDKMIIQCYSWLFSLRFLFSFSLFAVFFFLFDFLSSLPITPCSGNGEKLCATQARVHKQSKQTQAIMKQKQTSFAQSFSFSEQS